MIDDCSVPPPRGSGKFAPDDVLIYGTSLSTPAAPRAADEAYLKFDDKWRLVLKGKNGQDPMGETFIIIVAYGYAYEGHCYRFDKPKLLAFPIGVDAAKGEDAYGCGFEIPRDFPRDKVWYRLWRLKSAKRIMELTASVDDIQKLILEANLPGRRAPGTYRSEMQLAHRGGRLTTS